MGSGAKRVKFNTRERAVSNDHNRAQAMLARQTAEMVRWMMAATMGEELASGATSSTTSPLTGVILNGLWARPEIGTVNLFVEPGMCGVVNADASPSADDSPFKVMWSDGEQTAGALTLTAGGGGTRLDVVEFRRVEEVEETANRDIYDPATGTFSAALVDKVVRDKLEFRIRLGTPGAGFPGTVSGWLPIMVASVPNAAVTWNDCICWDVRPLMADRVRGPARVEQTFVSLRRLWATQANEGAGARLAGLADSAFLENIAGGDLGGPLAGYTDGQMPLLAGDFLEGGFVATNNRPWYLYAVFPHSLPRWARYTPSSSGKRQPLEHRGVLVFSQKAPASGLLQAAAAITMPTTLGFTTTQTRATPLLAGAYDDAGTLLDLMAADGWMRFGGTGVLAAAGNGILVSPSAGATTQTVTYDLVDNVTHPVGATAVRLRVTTGITFTGGANQGITMQRKVSVLDTAAGTLLGDAEYLNLSTGAAGVMTYAFEVEIPLHTLGGAMPSGAPITRQVEVDLAMSGGAPYTFANQRAFVVGWRLGA